MHSGERADKMEVCLLWTKLDEIGLNLDLLNHLRIILWGTIYLHNKVTNV